MQLTRDQARKAFASSGLTYDDLTPEALRRLRTLVGNDMKTSGCIRGTFRAANRFTSKQTPLGVLHALTCSASYFNGREAISFNEDGFIGFAGWADDVNVQPILRGFMAWVSELEAHVREQAAVNPELTTDTPTYRVERPCCGTLPGSKHRSTCRTQVMEYTR